MNTCSFYSYKDTFGDLNSCNRDDSSRPLILNCAGCVSTDFALTSDNPSGRDDYYLLVMTEGELILPDRTIRAQDVVIFPPRYHYTYTNTGDAHLCYLWAHFTGSYARELIEQIGLFPMPSVKHVSTSVYSDFCKIFDIYIENGILRDHLLSSALEHILLKLAADQSTAQSTLRSVSYIHSHYMEKISISELARMDSLSVSRYNTVFKDATGTAPIAYLIDTRMNVACELLRDTDMSVKNVGASVGYSDPQFFSKLFKRHVGMSPIEYREKN